MPNSAKHIFLLLLIVVIGGGALQHQSTSQSANPALIGADAVTQCQHNTQNSIANSGDHDPLVEHSSETNNTDTQPVTVTSCNSLLNILPAENDFSFNPGEQILNIDFYSSLLSSQIFVFQEPDPPRLG